MAVERSYPPEKLVPYDPAWADDYTVLAADLVGVLGPSWIVEHVGSTSVPGLAAKPVIDLAIRVPDGDHLHRWAPEFRDLGWGEAVPVDRHQVFVLHHGGVRVAIAHAFTAAQWPSAHIRLFADWLRNHVVDRDEYARLKHQLVTDGVWGADYTDAKTPFVQDVVRRARAATGLSGVRPQP